MSQPRCRLSGWCQLPSSCESPPSTCGLRTCLDPPRSTPPAHCPVDHYRPRRAFSGCRWRNCGRCTCRGPPHSTSTQQYPLSGCFQLQTSASFPQRTCARRRWPTPRSRSQQHCPLAQYRPLHSSSSILPRTCRLNKCLDSPRNTSLLGWLLDPSDPLPPFFACPRSTSDRSISPVCHPAPRSTWPPHFPLAEYQQLQPAPACLPHKYGRHTCLGRPRSTSATNCCLSEWLQLQPFFECLQCKYARRRCPDPPRNTSRPHCPPSDCRPLQSSSAFRPRSHRKHICPGPPRSRSRPHLGPSGCRLPHFSCGCHPYTRGTSKCLGQPRSTRRSGSLFAPHHLLLASSGCLPRKSRYCMSLRCTAWMQQK
mmetsp:Transcript_90804/g.207822  ORF Transcript_90804/g.207822 Transcript_90804/m.207822 type:complete len:367 (-) Transcript_90804:84-1184(-)